MKKVNLYTELKNGIIIIAIGKYSNLIIQFIILGILSRLLTPDDFGIVAIINVFLVFFSMLIDLGIGPAIIQNKTLTEQQINRIFTFTVLLSILLSVLFGTIARPIALFYDNEDLVEVFILMSLALFTSGINMVPQSILLKKKKFIGVNIAQVLSNIIYGVVGTVLAFNGFSYFAIVIATIVKNLVLFLIIFKQANIKLAKSIKLSDLKVIYSFSKNQFLFNLINYFSRNLDNILIGKFMSAKDLAYYDKAYTLSLYPNQILTNVITPVIQPIMSEYESQTNIIKETYLLVAKILAFVGMPLTVFLFMTSKEVIYIMFGFQWTGSIATFQILSLSIWIQMILSSTGSIFQSTNRTDLLLLSGILSSILNISSIIVGIWTGKIEYVAVVLVISFSINFIQANYLLMRKVFQTKQLEFYKVLIDPIIISIIVFVPLIIINMFLGEYSLAILIITKSIISLVMFLVGIKVTGNMNLIFKIIRVRKGNIQ
ncbi:lipopolysaccharide biosynthesis protein [Priestia aryabhattai]|uniref:lipopolysaccharide biosynthesis protein n=1 Tax=Priestia aryabhattai TaxID=412384 RepID=UPI002E1D3E98|nr:lipopolysaccharide biosynthesis protein [Priestia aryabhattai]